MTGTRKTVGRMLYITNHHPTLDLNRTESGRINVDISNSPHLPERGNNQKMKK